MTEKPHPQAHPYPSGDSTGPPRPVDLSAWAAALRHVPGEGGPPRVLMAGRGAVADRIVALAFAHGVPVREDADLAAVLAALDDDAAIPPEAMMAVAEVLAHLYRLNRALLPPSIRSGDRPC
ncbi:MAG: putative flagellar biosynthetic protein FlhB [Pseudomonadota bacterium]